MAKPARKLYSATELCERLAQYRLAMGDEDALQRGIARALETEGIAFEREVRRGADRIDFVVGRVGIECKIKDPVSKVTRQLYRYALWDTIDQLVCVTSVGRHRLLPSMLNGKPITVHVVRGLF